MNFKFVRIIIILFLLTFQTYSQSYIFDQTILIPQGFELLPQSGHGISTITNSSTEIGNMNPAALSLFDKLNVGISIKYGTKVNEAWLGGTYKEFLLKYNPQTVGIVVPYKNFRLGAALNQRYNAKLNYKIGVFSTANPEIFDYYYYDSKSEMRTYSFLASYLLKDYAKGNSLSIGFKFSNNVLYDYGSDYFMYSSSDLIYSKNNFSIGIIYSHPIKEEKYFNLGFSYDSKIKYESPFNNILLIERGFPYTPYEFKLGYPEKFKFELNSNYFDKLTLSTGINILGWNKVYDHVKNTVEFMANADYDAISFMKAALGFFYTNYQFNEKGANEFNNKLKALYIIGGIEYRYNVFNANLSVSDSHFFSGDWWKETIVKFGIGITI
ncbi:MAG: hypothetical protein ACM3O3_09300 [Syntrophothermus sp.]